MAWPSKAQAIVKPVGKVMPKGSPKVKRAGPTMKLSALKRAKSGY